MKIYYVYILASDRNGTLYVGVTNDLKRRIHEHKSKVFKGFTEKYKVDKLIWYESTESIEAALIKEKQMKKWNRDWKIKMIEEKNYEWKDLYEYMRNYKTWIPVFTGMTNT